jgi:hypothetical protein
METAPEASVDLNNLTLPSAQKDIVEFCPRARFKANLRSVSRVNLLITGNIPL